jgi:iron complex transport system substrate-binding protein
VTEILFALGCGRELVCVDQYSDFPEGARALPHLQGHQRIDHKALRSFRSELVFTSTIIQATLAEELRAGGFEVIHNDPRTLAGVYETIRSLGILLQREREAWNLERGLREGMRKIEHLAKLLSRRPRVYIEEWHNPPMVSGNWVPEVVALAGGEPFPLLQGAPSREVLLEEVTAFNPELIVLSICGAGKFAEKTLLTLRPGWSELAAVHSHHLFVIDDSLLNRPGPRLVEGAQRLYSWIFQVLHS